LKVAVTFYVATCVIGQIVVLYLRYR